MDYKIQNLTDSYIGEMRAMFAEEFKFIPKHIRQELDQYIKMIREKSLMFIAEYQKLMDQDDNEAINKYMI